MKRALASALLLTAAASASAQIAVKNQGYIPYDEAPINYRSEDITDAVTLLQKKLDQGKAKLDYANGDHGYLRSVLKLLDIPVSSQTLVFSKTSFQYPKISPEHPRALYFNDDVYVGAVHQGKEIEVVSFDLPHWDGEGEVMHLMSFISPLDCDLAVVYPRIAPVRLQRLLAERGIAVVDVPDEEFASQGANVLALGPRRALALEGNPETRRRMERAGVEVTAYRGDEISKKGDGGPTCLTRPLLRG